MKVLNIGSMNLDYVYSVDHIIAPGETQATYGMNVFLGGKGINQSIALAKAGVDIYHGGMIGEDGQVFLDACREHGVHDEFIRTIDEKTGHTIIQVDKDAQNCILLFGGANQSLTEEYIDEQIKNVLYKNDYQAIALIDILHQNVYLRLNHATKEIKENNYIDYQKVIDLVTQNQIAPKYRKQFIKNTSLKNLEENMKYLGYYSFKVFDLENKVVHYSYYWFDQKKKLCFVLLMI